MPAFVTSWEAAVFLRYLPYSVLIAVPTMAACAVPARAAGSPSASRHNLFGVFESGWRRAGEGVGGGDRGSQAVASPFSSMHHQLGGCRVLEVPVVSLTHRCAHGRGHGRAGQRSVPTGASRRDLLGLLQPGRCPAGQEHP